MSYLLEYRRWQLLFEAATVGLVSYDRYDTPIGPNVGDGVVILTPAPGVEVARIKLDGVEITQQLAQPLLDKITRFTRSEWGEYKIFVRDAAAFTLQIYVAGSDQPLPLQVKMTTKGCFAYYLAPAGFVPLTLTAKTLPTPQGLTFPSDHEERLKEVTADGGCCLVIKAGRPFLRVDSSWDNLIKGKNWLELSGLHFFYLTSNSFVLTFDFAPTLVEISFGQLGYPNSFSQLKSGSIQYLEIA